MHDKIWRALKSAKSVKSAKLFRALLMRALVPKKTAARAERSKTGEGQAEDHIGTDRASLEDLLSKGDEDVALFGGGRME